MPNNLRRPFFYIINFKPPKPLTPEEQLAKDSEVAVNDSFQAIMEIQVKLLKNLKNWEVKKTLLERPCHR